MSLACPVCCLLFKSEQILVLGHEILTEAQNLEAVAITDGPQLCIEIGAFSVALIDDDQRAQPLILSTVASAPCTQLPEAGRTSVPTAPGFQYAISRTCRGSWISKTRKPEFWRPQAIIVASLRRLGTHLSSL